MPSGGRRVFQRYACRDRYSGGFSWSRARLKRSSMSIARTTLTTPGGGPAKRRLVRAQPEKKKRRQYRPQQLGCETPQTVDRVPG